MSRRSYIGVAAALLLLTVSINLLFVYLCGDGLTPVGDSYSEANTIRAAERFAHEGFLKNWGLADPSYGSRFPGVGILGSSGSRPEDPIYHGYPPGPEWLSGVCAILLGTEHVWRFRIFPVALFTIAAALFLFSMARAIGRGRACIVFAMCLLTPMFSVFSHGLHYQGYALSLLLIQVSLVMDVMGPGGWGRARLGTVAALFVLGFGQGYLSFDYCVVTTLAAIPIALILVPESRPIRLRSLLVLCAAPGLGFIVAHVLHFAQSAAYLGGIREALDEYAFRAAKMYGATAIVEAHSRVQAYLIGLLGYAKAYLRWNHLFGVVGEATLAVLALVMVARRISFGFGRRSFEAIVTAPGRRERAGLVAAAFVGVGWMFLKPAHAINHISFVGCHLFLFQWLAWVIIARRTSIRSKREVAPGSLTEPEHRPVASAKGDHAQAEVVAGGPERTRVVLVGTSVPTRTSTWEVMYHVPE